MIDTPVYGMRPMRPVFFRGDERHDDRSGPPDDPGVESAVHSRSVRLSQCRGCRPATPPAPRPSPALGPGRDPAACPTRDGRSPGGVRSNRSRKSATQRDPRRQRLRNRDFERPCKKSRPGPSSRCEVAHKWITAGYRPTLVCRLAGVARSTYYAWRQRQARPIRQPRFTAVGRPRRGYYWTQQGTQVAEGQVLEWLSEYIASSDGPAYGYRKLTTWLRREHQVIINKKRRVSGVGRSASAPRPSLSRRGGPSGPPASGQSGRHRPQPALGDGLEVRYAQRIIAEGDLDLCQ
ncbi:Integrase catalytic region [Sulfobacillus acidophilus TPY]|nr:Integrase catalytic region [Sulfobacillus acidophilus TPY]